MSDSERIDYLLGQVASLKAFCMCVCLLHERPSKLKEGFSKFSEMTASKMLPTEASDAMLDGIEEIRKALARVLEDADQRRANPSKK